MFRSPSTWKQFLATVAFGAGMSVTLMNSGETAFPESSLLTLTGVDYGCHDLWRKGRVAGDDRGFRTVYIGNSGRHFA